MLHTCMLLEDTKTNTVMGELLYRCAFLSVDLRLREMGTFRGMRWDIGRGHSVRDVRMEEQILRSLKDSLPSTPTSCSQITYPSPHASELRT
jgi:hypothetical protein